jgi:Multisubunit Na+/H+ antiporter, MnhE subunit
MIRKIVICIFLTCVWLVLDESITLQSAILGFAISVLCVWISEVLLGFDYADTFALSLLPLLKYMVFLIKEIYVSGVKVTANILQGKAAPRVIQTTIDDKIQHPFLKHIVANTLTLIPGSIVIDQENEDLTILCLTSEDGDELFKKIQKHVLTMKKED